MLTVGYKCYTGKILSVNDLPSITEYNRQSDEIYALERKLGIGNVPDEKLNTRHKLFVRLSNVDSGPATN